MSRLPLRITGFDARTARRSHLRTAHCVGWSPTCVAVHPISNTLVDYSSCRYQELPYAQTDPTPTTDVQKKKQNREAESTALRRRLRLLWKTLCGLLCLGTTVSTIVTVVAAVELRRHLGRSFFALPLSVHLLLDALMALTPLLAARADGEGEPPPPVPTSQVRCRSLLYLLN